MKITRHYQFTPKLLPTIATLILLPILITLGIWQLHRAAYKEQLQTQYDQRQHVTPQTLQQLQSLQTDIAYYPVTMTGHFINERTLLLDNKMFQHRPGYQVVTPFKPSTGGPWVLVNRGWIPQGATRAQLPDIPKITKMLSLQGLIFVPPRRSFHLGSLIEPGVTTWPRRVLGLDLRLFSQLLNQPLTPFMVLLAPHQPAGFARDWAPVEMKASMHLGYAFQWFALATTLLIIFMVVNLRRTQ